MHNQEQERRKEQRFLAKRGAVALMESIHSKLGQVEDVSMGGLSFRYMQIKKESALFDAVHLFFPRYDFFIKQIPMRVVTDIEELNQSPFQTITVRRCGIQFLELSTALRTELDFFLKNYTVTK